MVSSLTIVGYVATFDCRIHIHCRKGNASPLLRRPHRKDLPLKMSDLPRPIEAQGAFPTVGPVTYLTDEEPIARALLADGALPPVTTWWHVTYPDRLASIISAGLVPSCWWGGDGCAVFGMDQLSDAPGWRPDDWVLEIQSPALPGSAKAWWVPARAIVGAWRHGRFHTVDELPRLRPAVQSQFINTPAGCSCPLTKLCGDQQTVWRSTWH